MPLHLLWVVSLRVHGDLFDFLHGEVSGLPEGADDDLWVHALLYERLALLEELTGQKYNTSRAVSNLS